MKKFLKKWIDPTWFVMGFVVIGYCIYTDARAYYVGGSDSFIGSFIVSFPNYIIWSIVIYLTSKNKPWRVFRKSAT